MHRWLACSWVLVLIGCNHVVLYEQDAGSCQDGTVACGDTCIAEGTCCTAADCPGGACPTPGGACETTTCGANEHVVAHNCASCPLGTTNGVGDDASGADTACDATTCAADQRVLDHACVACPAGSTNAVGDDASGNNTACDATTCAADQAVVNHVCTTCPAGSTNLAGDDASGNDTMCDATACASDQHVMSHACVACPPGSTNVAGDLGTGADTACDATACAANQYVSNHVCTTCPAGTTNAAGDDASGGDTTCDPTTCAINQYVSNHVCTTGAPGTYNAAGDNAGGANTTCDGCNEPKTTVCAGKTCGGFANSCGEVFDCGTLTTNITFPNQTSGNATTMAACTGTGTTAGWVTAPTSGTTTFASAWTTTPGNNCSFTASCGAGACAAGQGFYRLYNFTTAQDQGFYEGVVFGGKVGSTAGTGNATIRLSQYSGANGTGTLLAQSALPVVGNGAFVTFTAEAAILPATRSLKFEVILVDPITSFTFDDFFVTPTDCSNQNQKCNQTAGTCSGCANACSGATCGTTQTSECGVDTSCSQGSGCSCVPEYGSSYPGGMQSNLSGYFGEYRFHDVWCKGTPLCGAANPPGGCASATTECYESAELSVPATLTIFTDGDPFLTVCTNDHGNGSCTDPDDNYTVFCPPMTIAADYDCDGNPVPHDGAPCEGFDDAHAHAGPGPDHRDHHDRSG